MTWIFGPGGVVAGPQGAHFDLHSLKPRLSLKIKLEDVFLLFFFGGGQGLFSELLVSGRVDWELFRVAE